MFTAAVEPLPPSVSELLADRLRARAHYPIDRPSKWRTSRTSGLLLSRILGKPQHDNSSVLAVLARLLCDAFNRRIALGLPRDAPAIVLDFEGLQARPKGYERPPEWAERVPPLVQRVLLPDAEGRQPVKGGSDISEECKAMGIIVRMPQIHFI